MNFLNSTNVDNEAECASAAYSPRVTLISDFCSLDELRDVISNYKHYIHEHFEQVSNRIRENKITREDFSFMNTLSQLRPVYDDAFEPYIHFDIRETSKVKMKDNEYYLFRVTFELQDNKPPASNKGNNMIYASDDIVLFRTTVMMERSDYVKIKIKAQHDNYTIIKANNF